MDKRTPLQSALRALDRAHEPVALPDAHNLLARFIHSDLVELIDEVSEGSLAVNCHARQQIRRVDPVNNRDDLFDVVKVVLDDGQQTFICEALQHWRNGLAAAKYVGVTPRMRPGQPLFGVPLTADDGDPEQIIEAAAVGADHDGFGPLDQGVER